MANLFDLEEDEKQDDTFIAEKISGFDLSMVIGNKVAVEALRKVLYRVKFKRLYSLWGLTTPKGLLIYGPPGSGKTFASKCIISELCASGAKVVSLRSEDLSSTLVDGTQVVLKKFQNAVYNYAKNGPVVVFLDESETIFGSRTAHNVSTHDRARVNFFLRWIDGDISHNLENIIFIATTNEKTLIDEAIIRPGRLQPIEFNHITQKDELLACLVGQLEHIKSTINDTITNDLYFFSEEDKLELKGLLAGFNGSDCAKIVDQVIETKAFEFGKEVREYIKTIKEESQMSEKDAKVLALEDCMKTTKLISIDNFRKAIEDYRNINISRFENKNIGFKALDKNGI